MTQEILKEKKKKKLVLFFKGRTMYNSMSAEQWHEGIGNIQD